MGRASTMAPADGVGKRSISLGPPLAGSQMGAYLLDCGA